MNRKDVTMSTEEPQSAAEAPPQPKQKKNTGPNTPAGKLRSSKNAFQHGFRGQTLIMSPEQADIFLVYSKGLAESYQPVTFAEIDLVQSIAANKTRAGSCKSIAS